MKTDKEIKIFVDDLLKRMTLKEKIGQLFETIYEGGAITGPEYDTSQTIKLLKAGLVGSILGQYDNEKIYALQKTAVEDTRLGIPLFFANDIIHGCRTMFPINLGMACTWNPDLVKEASKVAAYESSHSGVHVTFSPMVDLVRDARFGRVMESNGEDPYLSSVITKAYVEGYQQGNISGENAVASCVKHYAGYGAVEAGRDYNSVEMSTDSFEQFYLPPFKAAVDAGVEMVMASFNTFNGVPATCNKYLLRDILRKKLKFKNVVISDFTATEELIKHKVARNEYDCAKKSMIAGLDHEMVAMSYIHELENVVRDTPEVETLIDEACARVLTLKARLGLFENPYKNIYFDFEKYWLHDDALETSLKVASETITLLENDGILPLNKKDAVGYCGPFVKEKRVVGAWGGKVNFEDTVTLYDSLVKNKIKFGYTQGCTIFEELDLNVVKQDLEGYETVVLNVGEEQWMSGENKSRAFLDLPKCQDKLIDYVISLNKKVILVIHSGRPLVLTKYKKLYEEGKINAIVYAWFLGTRSGDAIVNTIYGKTNPSSHLAMSFPYAVGQCPIYYNRLQTGRPQEINKSNEYLTRYIDIPNEPLYPFGYGLSYCKFIYENLIVLNSLVTKQKPLEVEVTITNDSSFSGKEVVQLYIECLYGELSRPLKELKGFKKVSFKPHETKTLKFSVKHHDLSYVINGKKVVESGEYRVYVGTNVGNTLVETFKVSN